METTETKKKCSRCCQTKSLDLFHRQRASKDGHRPECKMCRTVEWYFNQEKKKHHGYKLAMKRLETQLVEVQAPKIRVSIWGWIKRLFK